MRGLCKAHQHSQAERWRQNGIMSKHFQDVWKGHEIGLSQWQDAVGRMAEAVVDDMLGDDDVASVAQSAMNTPYAQALSAWKHHYSIYKNPREAWKHALYELGIWVPGQGGEHAVLTACFNLDKSLKELRNLKLQKQVDSWVKHVLPPYLSNITKDPAQIQGICQLWKRLALE